MSSEIKRIRNSFTGVDFHSFPWLLKCHRVSWFECKVAQLAPIMLNVKTCEDSFLNQPHDRQQNTSAFSCQPRYWARLPLVNQRPFNHSWPPARLGWNYSWRKLQVLSHTASEPAWLTYLKPSFRYISPRLLLQSRLFWAYQAEWFCGCCCWPYIGRTMSQTSGTPLGNWHVCQVIIFVCV